MTFARDTPDGCSLSVRVDPGAKKDAVTGLHDGAVKIGLSAVAVDGRANDALIVFVAGQLHVPRARVALMAGAASRNKTLRIAGKSAAEAQAVLSPERDA